MEYRSRQRVPAVTFAVGCGLSAAPTLALAQSQPSSAIEEVVVTAQHRTERSQHVPIAITTLSAKQLERRAITSVAGLQSAVPSVHYYVYNNAAYIAVRGVGGEQNASPTADPAVALHEDGVYRARATAALGSFFDLSRVEVLRGPQGTLYGRNATGGSIDLISHEPELHMPPTGSLDASYGNYNAFELRGVLNVPLGDKAALRLSGLSTGHDGYAKNLYGSGGAANNPDDDRSRYLRAQVRLVPTTDDTITVGTTYGSEKGRGQAVYLLQPLHDPVLTSLGALPNPQPRDVRVNDPGAIDNISWFERLRWDHTFDFATLTLQGAAVQEHDFIDSDVDRTNANLATNVKEYHNDQKTLELRLVSASVTPVKWIAGIFAIHEDNTANSPFYYYKPFNLSMKTYDNGHTDSYAAYGEATYQFAPTWRITGGTRYTIDQKTSSIDITGNTFSGASLFAFDFPGKHQWSAPTGRGVLEHDLSPDNLVYASVSRGYKSGGYGVTSSTPFKPEYIWAYEIGSKNTFLNGRLLLNVSGFYYDQRDLQVSKAVIFAGQELLEIENAATAHTLGGEVEAKARLTRELSVDLSLTGLNAVYDKYRSADIYQGTAVQNLDGHQKPDSPHTAGSFGVEYTQGLGKYGALDWRIDLVFSSAVVLRSYDVRPVDQQDPYFTLGSALHWQTPYKGVSLDFFGRNLTNELIKASSFAVSTISGGPALPVVYYPPRTFGVRMHVPF